MDIGNIENRKPTALSEDRGDNLTEQDYSDAMDYWNQACGISTVKKNTDNTSVKDDEQDSDKKSEQKVVEGDGTSVSVISDDVPEPKSDSDDDGSSGIVTAAVEKKSDRCSTETRKKRKKRGVSVVKQKDIRCVKLILDEDYFGALRVAVGLSGLSQQEFLADAVLTAIRVQLSPYQDLMDTLLKKSK